MLALLGSFKLVERAVLDLDPFTPWQPDRRRSMRRSRPVGIDCSGPLSSLHSCSAVRCAVSSPPAVGQPAVTDRVSRTAPTPHHTRKGFSALLCE